MSSNTRVLSRRALLAALGPLSLACSRKEPLASAEPLPKRSAELPKAGVSSASSARPVARLPAEERTWTFEKTPVGRMSVVVVLPERAENQRFPALIAMHGRGETLKGPERGARGWVDDYALKRAIERLSAPPLVAKDFAGFADEERLARLNAGLAKEPYGGLVVVCPYTPDVLGREEPFTTAPPLAEFLVETLLPKVYRETPALGTPASTGIDGVSLGGRASFAVGFLRPEAFGAVAGLQAAFDPENAREFGVRAARARQKNPSLSYRLLTSDADYYLGTTHKLDAALTREGVPHEFLVTRGTHSYEFNRGPGAIEMLVYHDRVLRRRPPI
jgi:enterochelin esterase-like enzyme